MAAPVTNWVSDRDKISDSSRNALEKAVKMERKRLREGWRWVKLSSRTKIFVPCDKKGNPTEEGLRIIREFDKAVI